MALLHSQTRRHKISKFKHVLDHNAKEENKNTEQDMSQHTTPHNTTHIATQDKKTTRTTTLQRPVVETSVSGG